jgi:hypothetical protein
MTDGLAEYGGNDAFRRPLHQLPGKTAGRMVLVRSHAERIVVLFDDTVVAEHPRQFRRDQIIYEPLALPVGSGEKARRLAQWRALQGLGPADGGQHLGQDDAA